MEWLEVSLSTSINDRWTRLTCALNTSIGVFVKDFAIYQKPTGGEFRQSPAMVSEAMVFVKDLNYDPEEDEFIEV